MLDEGTIGLILPGDKLLVIECNTVASMGRIPEDKYFIHPKDLASLPAEVKIAINAVCVSHGITSPFERFVAESSVRSPGSYD